MLGPYIFVGITGLVHGLEPGHGWPLAVFLTRQRGRRAGYAGLSALILGLGHLVSSFAVVGAYLVANEFLDFSSDIFGYVAAAVLVLIAVKMWREQVHESDEPRHKTLGLACLAWFALILGFAHEEEFVLLALAVGGLSPVALMTVYAVAVIISMVAITLVVYYSFRRFERRFARIEPHLPKVTALALFTLAGLILFDVY